MYRWIEPVRSGITVWFIWIPVPWLGMLMMPVNLYIRVRFGNAACEGLASEAKTSNMHFEIVILFFIVSSLLKATKCSLLASGHIPSRARATISSSVRSGRISGPYRHTPKLNCVTPSFPQQYRASNLRGLVHAHA